MYNSRIPSQSELPSSRKLAQSTIIAAIVAFVLLVTVVLPAEYGIDPTRIGSFLRLTKMGEIKQSLAKEAAAQTNEVAIAESGAASGIIASKPPGATSEKPAQSATIRSDKMSLVLAPDKGAEIKVTMAAGKLVEYSWSTDGGMANFDIHGDSKAQNIKYHPYSKGSSRKEEGQLIAAFDGNHGWFWRNRSARNLTITLETSGEYTEISKMQ